VVLADAAVGIDWLRRRATPATARLDALLDEGDACIAPVILQDLLQGARSPQALAELRRRFAVLPMLEPAPGGTTHAEAGALYARCRWAGVTPRSPRDCVIARLAIEYELPLLHDDRHFEAIAGVEPTFRLLRA
jgi:hypothetical protein